MGEGARRRVTSCAHVHCVLPCSHVYMRAVVRAATQVVGTVSLVGDPLSPFVEFCICFGLLQ